MKVESGRLAGTTGARRTGGGGSGFAAAISSTDAAETAAPLAASSGIAGVSGLFMLQEIGGGLDDRQAASRGGEILDRLDELRRGLLLGRIAPDRLSRLATIAAGAAATASDPRLRSILEEIELRAHVELAKLDLAGVAG